MSAELSAPAQGIDAIELRWYVTATEAEAAASPDFLNDDANWLAASVAEAFHFVAGRQAVHKIGPLDAQVIAAEGRWWLVLQSTMPALSVHIEDEHYRAADNWFHLAPRRARQIELIARHRDAPPPAGQVMALNCPVRTDYRASLS